MLNIEDIKKNDDELFKYVKVNGEYRFCYHYQQHSFLLKDGETAQSAGFFNYCNNAIKLFNERSMTLNCYPLDDDDQNLGQLLNANVKSRVY